MIRQFLRLIIIRNFSRHRFHTFLNILGLSVGLGAFIMIMLFVNHERSYDTFHNNYNNIYRIIAGNIGDFHGGTPAELAPYLEERVPEIKEYVRMEPREDVTVLKGDEMFFEKKLLYADSSLFSVFDFKLVEGDPSRVLRNPNSMVITESMARKYFGEKNPVGKTVYLSKDKVPFTVEAVAADPPTNSTIEFNFIIPFKRLEKNTSWGSFNFTTYLHIDNRYHEQAEKKIQEISVDRKDRVMQLNFLKLQPLKELRFIPIRGNEFPTIEKKYIYIYLSAAFFVLLLAVINYTNLASAISLKRSKEVALKKIAGSSKSRIIAEILIESILLSMIALLLALIFVELLRPGFNQAIQKNLHFDYSRLPFYIMIAISTGILAGLYPAIYSSGFNIMGLLKESFYKGKKAGRFRNILVLVQFGVTSFLLICSLVYIKQLNYLNSKNLGLNPHNIYTLQVHWPDVKVEQLKQELLIHSDIEGVTTTSFGAGLVHWNQTAYWKGSKEEERITMYLHEVDKDFFETLNIPFREGGEYYKQQKRTKKALYILNEAAQKHIGWENALNKSFSVFGSHSYGEVVGVSENFNFRSLHHKIDPSVFLMRAPVVRDNMLIRYKPEKANEVLNTVRQKWDELAPPNAPFMLTSLEKDFENLYNIEQNTKKIVIYFTIIAIIISFLGLLGLATYISLQRTKEIGVRKVLGSTESGIINMLVGSFMKWVIVAFVIASPLAYLFMEDWLRNFAYHTKITVWVFLIAGLFAIGIGFFSVIFQSLKAANTNPVDSLRYE